MSEQMGRMQSALGGRWVGSSGQGLSIFISAATTVARLGSEWKRSEMVVMVRAGVGKTAVAGLFPFSHTPPPPLYWWFHTCNGGGISSSFAPSAVATSAVPLNLAQRRY